jgi:hypothetical protein
MDEVSCVGDIIIKMIGIDTDIDICCMRRAIIRNVSLRSPFQKVKWGTWKSLWKEGGRTGPGVGGEIFRGSPWDLYSAILQTQRGLRLTNCPLARFFALCGSSLDRLANLGVQKMAGRNKFHWRWQRTRLDGISCLVGYCLWIPHFLVFSGLL